MIHLFETELAKEKSIVFSLQNIYGIGNANAKKICKFLGFSLNMKVKFLTMAQVLQIIKIIEDSKLLVTTELKKNILINNSKYVSIKTYRGLRKLQGLPIRGQRTHSNAKTARKKF